jgi:hypothetical protein
MIGCSSLIKRLSRYTRPGVKYRLAMHKLNVVGVLFAFGGLTCLAQTNSTPVPPPTPLQKVPTTIEEMLPIHLRPGGEHDAPQAAAARAEHSTPAPVQISASYERMTGDIDEGRLERIYRKLDQMDREGRLMQPDEPSDNLFARAMDAVFRPEVIKIGDTAVACSVITAIKRKNPFCLLNPMVIQVAW